MIWRFLTYGITLLAIASAVAYFVLTSLLTSRPPDRPVDGWVAALQPSDRPSGDTQTRVTVAILRGRVSYTVAACGSTGTEGWLVVGGDARLVAPTTLDTNTNVREGRLSLAYDSELDLGEVQVMSYRFEALPECNETEGGFAGVATGMTGGTNSPFVVGSKTGPLRGPRLYFSSPVTGGVPGIPRGMTGVFNATGVIQGDVVFPHPRESVVTGLAIGPSVSLEEARPPVEAKPELEWRSDGVLRAQAVFVKLDYVARLQMWSSLVAILFGVASSATIALWLSINRQGIAPSRRRGEQGDS